mmetsp:Transcript_25006/g.63425  ORF Transcript_25006/g.63425 Transcript_25006/m.63425 type:complete len:211 (-) Transcript_25006:8-640(-)
MWRVGLGCCPPLDLRQLVDDEDALALRFGGGFHYPHLSGVLAELLHKQRVVGGQQECGGQEVKVDALVGQLRCDEAGGCALDPARLARELGLGVQLLHLLAVPLDVLHHQVLASQLVVVGEVVDQLVVAQPVARLGVEELSHRVHARPIKVPVALVGAAADPAAPLKVLKQDRLFEVGLEARHQGGRCHGGAGCGAPANSAVALRAVEQS